MREHFTRQARPARRSPRVVCIRVGRRDSSAILRPCQRAFARLRNHRTMNGGPTVRIVLLRSARAAEPVGRRGRRRRRAEPAWPASARRCPARRAGGGAAAAGCLRVGPAWRLRAAARPSAATAPSPSLRSRRCRRARPCRLEVLERLGPAFARPPAAAGGIELLAVSERIGQLAVGLPLIETACDMSSPGLR